MDGSRRVALRCPGNRSYGAVADGSGDLAVWCSEKWCRRPGSRTRHLFNLATGTCATEYVPDDRGATQRAGRPEPVAQSSREIPAAIRDEGVRA